MRMSLFLLHHRRSAVPPLLLSFIVLIILGSQQHNLCTAFGIHKNDAPSLVIGTNLMMAVPRYGPVGDSGTNTAAPSSSSNSDSSKDQLKAEFTSLLHKVMDTSTSSTTDQEDKLPSLFTTNIEMILNVISTDGLLEEIISDDVQSFAKAIPTENDNNNNTTQQRLENVSNAVNVILSFIETFVEQTKSMDDVYKDILGKIFKLIAPSTSSGNDDSLSLSSSSMETQLDNLLTSEKVSFTPGFLRHVEGECRRISSLSTMSPESVKMLQILRLIQTRILEELGKGIGEGAIVLGQLLGYDDEYERHAVLEAGLAVRGLDFANELVSLTEEALNGFMTVQQKGGQVVDLQLVKCVEMIDERIKIFIEKEEEKNNSFE